VQFKQHTSDSEPGEVPPPNKNTPKTIGLIPITSDSEPGEVPPQNKNTPKTIALIPITKKKLLLTLSTN